VRFLALALVTLVGCYDDHRFAWYPVYPLPDETAIDPERLFAINARGGDEPWPDTPCDEPERLPTATIIDLDRRSAMDVRSKCINGYHLLQPAEPLRAETNYWLQLVLDPDDEWDLPVYSAASDVEDARVTLSFSTARRPAVVSAHWSGWLTDSNSTKSHILYLMFSQQCCTELAVSIEDGADWKSLPTYQERQWFTQCDALSVWCDASYFGRQHIVRAHAPRHGRVRVSGTASDGTPFGPQIIQPEE
jgi:hypothetical protein